jgi:oligopeptide transport system permease protein
MTKTNDSKIFRRLRKNPGAVAGMVVIGLSVIISLCAYFLSPDSSPDANRMVVEIGGMKPGYKQTFLLLPKKSPAEQPDILSRFLYGTPDRYDYMPIVAVREEGNDIVAERLIDKGVSETVRFNNSARAIKVVEKTFVFGTDKYGRDILSRLIIGTRVSLAVGLITVIISLTLGILLGSIAGYFRGRTDDIVMWFINVIWSIPTLLLVFAITLLLGKGFWQIFIAIGLTMWVNVARIVRGQVMVVRELEYVEAAKALGYSTTRIIGRHILPNIIGPVMVVAASNFATAIIIEAGLSFLGIGVQPPQPSWGLMIKENYNFIITQNPMLALIPGLAIMLLVLAFNLVGNGLRDAFDVKA